LPRRYEFTETVPDVPTTKLMHKLEAKYKMAIVVPLYEEEMTGLYYNTAVIIDADGRYLGKYRKHHIPHCLPGFWEKFYFKPGNLGFPTFETAYARVGVYICYDRHFPEGARCLGLNVAEIVFNPSATVAGLSEYLWKLEQPAHAVRGPGQHRNGLNALQLHPSDAHRKSARHFFDEKLRVTFLR